MTPQSQIKYHYREACKIASKEVERLARKILREHSNLDEFVMGMGQSFFTIKEDRSSSSYIHPSERSYMKPLDNFFSKWDEFLKLSGEPMRFTAKGKTIRDW